MQAADEIVATISAELQHFPQLIFAVLFGSAAAGRLQVDSDLDVAVYGGTAGALEIEQTRELEGEVKVQLSLERATGRNVELLVLNRAPATVCAQALQTGRTVLMRDRAGKIVLAAAAGPVPYTYGQILAELEAVDAFAGLSGRLQALASLRKVLAHEYLDIRFGPVTEFVEVGATAVGELAQLTKAWASERDGSVD